MASLMLNKGKMPGSGALGRSGWWFLRATPGLVLLLGVLACGPGPTAAQGLNPLTAGSAQPIDITADSGIEWQQDKQLYIARGNAVAKRGTSEVHADVLTAHYRPSKNKSDGGNEVYRLDADGHVVIMAPNRTVVGDQAIYDVDQQIGIVTGQHLKLTTPTDVVTARDSLEWYDQQQVAVARGDAIAIRGDRRIRADVLTAHFIKDKTAESAGSARPGARKANQTARATRTTKTAAAEAAASGKPGQVRPGAAQPLDNDEASSKISRIDAQGHVVVATAADVGRGDYGVYNAQTGIVTLLGNVTITRGQDAVKGQYAVVDLNTNISRIMTYAAKPGAPAPRVEGLFYRQDSTAGPSAGQKTGAKPAAPGTAPKS
jgi:lipopolysaccharide export system protein LptA